MVPCGAGITRSHDDIRSGRTHSGDHTRFPTALFRTLEIPGEEAGDSWKGGDEECPALLYDGVATPRHFPEEPSGLLGERDLGKGWNPCPLVWQP